MAATLTTLANSLKDVYDTEKMRRTFNRRRFLLEQLERRRRPVKMSYGNRIITFLHTAGSGAGSARAENANSPVAHNQSINFAQFVPSTYQRKVQFTGEVIEQTKADYAASSAAMELELTSAMQDLRDDMGMDLWLPQGGYRALINAAAVSTTVLNIQITNSVFGMKYLKVGQKIAVLTQADTPLIANGVWNAEITDVDHDASTITIDTALGDADLSAGYYIMKSPDGASDATLTGTDWQDGAWGIIDIINDANPTRGSMDGNGNYGGIDRSSNTFWKAQNVDADGAGPTHELAADLIEKILTRSNGEPQFGVCSHKMFNRCIDLHTLYNAKIARMSETKASGYFKYVELANIPIFPDQYAPAEGIYFFDMRSWQIAENKAPGWEDRDGSILHRVTNKWALEALLVRMHNYICKTPNAQGFIDNMSEAAGG